MAPAPRSIMCGQHGARHAEGAVQRDVEHRLPLLVGHLDDAGVAAEAGVVHQHVDVAELADRRADTSARTWASSVTSQGRLAGWLPVSSASARPPRRGAARGGR